MSAIFYRKNQALPALTIAWYDGTGTLVDFSSGWTLSALICARGSTTALVTKTTGITGAATSPNVTVDWSATEFSGLTAGAMFDVYVKAVRNSDSKVRYFRPGNPPQFTLLATPA